MTLGFILVVLMCAIMPYNDNYVVATSLSGNFFPIGALAALLLLVLGINPLLIACGRRERIWTSPEIISVWTMLLVSAGIPSSGLLRYLIPQIVAPYYFAHPNNGWAAGIPSQLPRRLLVTDPAAVRGFFQGLDRGETIPWHSWAEPLAWWAVFTAFLFLAYFCLSALLRRQWAEYEKFTFPLVQLPLLLSEEPEPAHRFNKLLRSPLLWLGVVSVTCLHTARGLHLFVPTLPDIPMAWHSQSFITIWPWSAVNDIEFAVYPLMLGFAYLLSSEVCLSLWLFYLLFKVQVLFANLNNWNLAGAPAGNTLGPAFVVYHETGGVLMMALWLLYSMRGHLADIWRKAVHRDAGVDDAREPLSYRFALFGAAAAFIGLYCWLTLVAGIQALMAFGLLAGAFMVFLVLSWLVAQAGLLFVSETFSSPHIMTTIAGSAPFNSQSLVMSAIAEHVGWYDAREFMMPSLMNAGQAAAATRLSSRSLTRTLATCVVVATLVGGAASIWLPYTHGGALALKNSWAYINAPQVPMQWISGLASGHRLPDGNGILHIIGGALFVLAMLVSRSWLPGFELHPAGFLVASSWAMYTLWFSLFLGWLIKAPILRYGGIAGYRTLLPLFLGLILGDCMNAIIWTIIGILTGTGYTLLPS